MQKDYHLIVPNLRGFGKSGFVGNDETTGTFFDIAGDVNCLLQAEKVAQATCVGYVRSYDVVLGCDWVRGTGACVSEHVVLDPGGEQPWGLYSWEKSPLIGELQKLNTMSLLIA